MLKFDSFYFQCPNCHAWLEGRNLKAEMVNQAILCLDAEDVQTGDNEEYADQDLDDKRNNIGDFQDRLSLVVFRHQFFRQ